MKIQISRLTFRKRLGNGDTYSLFTNIGYKWCILRNQEEPIKRDLNTIHHEFIYIHKKFYLIAISLLLGNCGLIIRKYLSFSKYTPYPQAPSRSWDFTSLSFVFCGDPVKDKCYEDNPQTINNLKTNTAEVIAEGPHTVQIVLKNGMNYVKPQLCIKYSTINGYNFIKILHFYLIF